MYKNSLAAKRGQSMQIGQVKKVSKSKVAVKNWM